MTTDVAYRVQYFIASLFNVHLDGFRTAAGLDDKDKYISWIRQRIDLFTSITLPSIEAQSRRNFQFLVIFDTELTPDISDLVDRLKSTEFCIPLFIDMRGKTRFDGKLSHVIRPLLRRGFSHISMTKIDSDDAIHKDFIQSIRLHCMQNEAEICSNEMSRILFPFCSFWAKGDVWLGINELNQFQTIVSPMPGRAPPHVAGRTAFALRHSTPFENDMHIFTKEPATLTCIHGGNLWNARPRAFPVKNPDAVLEKFGLSAAGMHAVTERVSALESEDDAPHRQASVDSARDA